MSMAVTWPMGNGMKWKGKRAVTVSRTQHSISSNRVKWFTDNQNVVQIIKVGSKVPELQKSWP